jgi:predicted lipoprotein
MDARRRISRAQEVVDMAFRVIRTKQGIALFSLAIAQLVGCDEAPTAPVDDPARRMLVAGLVERVMLPNYRDFAARAAALESATQQWATSGAAADRGAAQAAWRAANEAWQRAELHSVGPAGMNLSVAGGMDLRDEIYAWPLVNRCRVDQETVARVWETPGALAAEAVNARGLGAIEYLLFRDDGGNACAPLSTLNTDGSWAALGDAEVATRRAAYAREAARLVREKADALVAAWEPTGGGFATQLSSAGTTSTLFRSSQAGLNAVSDAMLYLEEDVKDMKLATPGGLSTDCVAMTCPELLEAPVARASKESVLANLRGFEALFLGAPAGTEAYGFDDLLVEVGAGTLASSMRTELVAALAAVDAVPGTFDEALAPGNTAGRAAFVAAYDAVKRLTDLQKTQFLTVLDLELPNRLEADND